MQNIADLGTAADRQRLLDFDPHVSVASALLGALIGLVHRAGASSAAACPAGCAPTVMTFSGVASNFAGVPLAFAFLATLGRLGLVTVLLQDCVRLQPLHAPASTS